MGATEVVADVLGKGASLPPLNDTRDEEVLLAREPGLSGEEKTGECA